MTEEQILRLYGLKGTIQGMMTAMKCELRANHKVREIYSQESQHRWLDGRNEIAIRSLQSLNCLRRQLDQAIKEAERKEPPQ